METKAKQSKTAVATVARPVAARGAAAAPIAAPVVVGDESSCEALLAQVIRLAQAVAAPDAAAAQGAVAAVVPVVVPVPSRARESFESAIASLPADVARKLRMIMLMGREGKSINEVNADTSLSDSQALLDAVAPGAGEDATSLAEQLRRGHAVAWAAALDLERPIASWSATKPQSLDERAWLSFGKQLAKSNPADWQCLGFVEPGAPGISRLYLRLAEHAWWSFQSVLDRPSAAAVAKQQRTLASRRSKGLSSRSLESVAPQLSSAPGRALRRAARAIRARIGETAATP